MVKVTVVLPTYNEKDNIVELINRLTKVLNDYELIVVDDDSPDLTWKIVKDLKRKNVRSIRRVGERGIASAIGRGIKEAKGDYVVWMDCDMSMPPEKVPMLIKKLDLGADITIGSRYVKGGKDSRPKIRQITSYLFNIYTQLVLGHGVKDYDSGFIAVKSKVFKSFKFPAYGYGEYFIEFVYKAAKKGFKIVEVGYNNIDRIKGESKTAENIFVLFKYGIQYGIKVIKLRLTK